MKGYVLMLGCLVLLGAGCASGPRYTNYRPSVAPPPEGYGRVWFYRPAVMGAMVQPEVKFDGQPVGRAVSRGVFHVDAPPGTHEVSASTEWKHTTTVTVVPNADTYVRLKTLPGLLVRHIVPQQVSEDRALNELTGMRVID
jgi:hypothetical protein